MGKKYNREVIRCYRYQRFGHSAECCAYRSRCVICGESHDSSECIDSFKALKEKNEKVPQPKCVNCSEIGHPASYQGCPAYLKYKEKKQLSTQKARQSASNSRSFVENSIYNFTNANVSFAEKAKTSIYQAKAHKPNTPGSSNIRPSLNTRDNAPKADLNDFLNEAKNLFNISFKDLLVKIRQFWPTYQQLQGKEEKMFSYLNFVASIVI